MESLYRSKLLVIRSRTRSTPIKQVTADSTKVDDFLVATTFMSPQLASKGCTPNLSEVEIVAGGSINARSSDKNPLWPSLPYNSSALVSIHACLALSFVLHNLTSLRSLVSLSWC